MDFTFPFVVGGCEGCQFIISILGTVAILFSFDDSFFFFFFGICQGIRVKIQNSGKNWFFWFSLLGGEN